MIVLLIATPVLLYLGVRAGMWIIFNINQVKGE